MAAALSLNEEVYGARRMMVARLRMLAARYFGTRKLVHDLVKKMELVTFDGSPFHPWKSIGLCWLER